MVDDGVTDPVVAARDRVDALLERMTRVDLQVVVVARPDPTRLAARDRARAAAVAADRGDLFDGAVRAAREMTLRAFARAGFSGTWAATDMSVSVANASDRVAAAAAFEEAAMAEVVNDLVDAETLDVLRASSDELDRSTGMPSPGALSSFARSAAVADQGPLQGMLVIAFVIVGVAVWLFLGPGLGLLVIAGGVASTAWLSRRRSGRGS